MNTRRNFSTKRAPKLSETLQKSVISDNLIFIWGMPGFDTATGQVVSSNFEDQVRQSLELF